MPCYRVSEPVDVIYVPGRVRRYAEEQGFGKPSSTELAIVASELASNILKYGGHGTVDASSFGDTRGLGVALIARDHGPPFFDLEIALQDGCDDRGPIDPLLYLKRRGIGGGLGAIVRFTHSFQVEPLDDGKRIIVTRYLTPST